MRRLAPAMLVLGALACSSSAEPFEYEQVGTAVATVGGIFLEVDYGPDGETLVRGLTTRLAVREGDEWVQAGVFVQRGYGSESSTSYQAGAAEKPERPGVDLRQRTDRFLIDELGSGDYLICGVTLDGDICATFTVEP